ncbi:hypothetical protein AMECASPLE_028043 [Ameca splendens]|uniref:Uncharacterized protein n=1 Tax=Ameca splendens TaxID=208324 RepID=A0ABV1A3D7_9TELE
MEEGGSCKQPTRLAGGMEGFFFPQDPLIHHAIEAERQRALDEIVASMRRPPAPSFACLSTEARRDFSAHGFAPDQPLPLPPTTNPVPGPVPEGFMHRQPSGHLLLRRRPADCRLPQL